MKKRTRNILFGTGMVAVLGIAASHQISNYLMKIAMDREMPKDLLKKKQHLKGNKELVDLMDDMVAASEQLENCVSEIVKIQSYDGLTLTGHWRPAPNAKRVIIAMHGWRSTWSRDFGIIADFWYESGCSVLYAEQRGQGKSDGDYMGFGLLERYDCLEWIRWVNEHTGERLPVYLGGVSMGATTVLMTSGMELPDTVKGIVADCGFTSPYAIWKHVVENNLHMPYAFYQAAANDLCRKKIHVGAKEYSAVDAMKKCKVPVLFIHGTDDKFVPVEMTYENYKACVAPKRLLVVPGADHGMSYQMDKAGYENSLFEFFAAYDTAGKEAEA